MHVRTLIWLLCLAALGLYAVSDYLLTGKERRTLVFYTETQPVVEERLLARAATEEESIKRYVEEVLLGPVTMDAQPLFAPGSTLDSLLFRRGVVYVELSESAALPPRLAGFGTRSLYANLLTLQTGIRRNFSQVREARCFIAGNQAFVRPRVKAEVSGEFPANP